MDIQGDVLTFESRRDWEDWLTANHDSSAGIWMRIGRKKAGLQSITYEEAVEVSLCFGWIDAIRKRYDPVSFVQRFTPRKPGGIWSLINRQKAEQLMEAGLMHPAGLKAVETAKAKGAWDKAYEPQSIITIPEELEKELEPRPMARAFFESLDSRNRYAILHRIQTASNPETRAGRIRKFVSMLEEGKKLYE